MRRGSLGFFMNDGQVLLGRKKKGTEIGEHTLNGVGGKEDPCDEGSLERCLIRESEDESGLTPTQFEKRAIITFHWNGEANFEVHVYLVTEWLGETRDTDEMFDFQWYSAANLPFSEMLEADSHWLGELLAGKKFNATVYYRLEDGKLIYVVIDFQPFAG